MFILTGFLDLIYLSYIPFYIFNEKEKRKMKTENVLYALRFGSDIIFLWALLFGLNNIWIILSKVFQWSNMENYGCIPIQIIIFALFIYIYIYTKWKIVLTDEKILIYRIFKKSEFKYSSVTYISNISTVYMFFSGNNLLFQLSYKHNEFSSVFIYTIADKANIKIHNI